MLADDVVDGSPTLPFGGMSEHGTAVDIADSIYSGNVGKHIVVDRYALSVIRNTGFLQCQTIGIGSASGGYEHDVGTKVIDIADAVLHVKLHPAFLQRFPQPARNVLVYGWETHGKEFIHINFTAESVESRGKFHSYDSGTDNGKRRRNALYIKQFGRCYDFSLSRLHAFDGKRWQLCVRTSGNNDIISGEKLISDFYRMSIDKLGGALNECDIRLREKGSDAAPQLLNNLILTLLDT